MYGENMEVSGWSGVSSRISESEAFRDFRRTWDHSLSTFTDCYMSVNCHHQGWVLASPTHPINCWFAVVGLRAAVGLPRFQEDCWVAVVGLRAAVGLPRYQEDCWFAAVGLRAAFGSPRFQGRWWLHDCGFRPRVGPRAQGWLLASATRPGWLLASATRPLQFFKFPILFLLFLIFWKQGQTLALERILQYHCFQFNLGTKRNQIASAQHHCKFYIYIANILKIRKENIISANKNTQPNMPTNTWQRRWLW